MSQFSIRNIQPEDIKILIREDSNWDFDLSVWREVITDDLYQMERLAFRISRARTVVDLGANIGTWSFLFHYLNPQTKIYLVEPNPNNLIALKANLSHLFSPYDRPQEIGFFYQQHKPKRPNMTLIEAAICDGDSAELALSFGGRLDGIASRVKGTRSYIKDDVFEPSMPVHKVRCMKLNQIMKEYNIDFIDILKLDCEGCEDTVLNEDLSRVGFITGEYHDLSHFEAVRDWVLTDFEVRHTNHPGQVGMFWARNRKYSSLPCGHVQYEVDCKFCHAAQTDHRYHALYTHDLRDFIEVRGNLPEKIVRQSEPIKPKPKQQAKRSLPCIHLGDLVQHARCNCPRKDIRKCDLLQLEVTQERTCEGCEHYQADQ